jgi:hypothetical protein
MTEQKVQVVLFTSDPDFAAWLNMLLAAQDAVIVYHGTGPQATSDKKLDALFLYGMQGSYFGVQPPEPGQQAQVFVTPAEKRILGLPGLFIAGALAPSQAPDEATFARRAYELLLQTAQRYNETHRLPILRIGSVPENFGVHKLNPNEALRSLVDAAEEAEDLRHVSLPQSTTA